MAEEDEVLDLNQSVDDDVPPCCAELQRRLAGEMARCDTLSRNYQELKRKTEGRIRALTDQLSKVGEKCDLLTSTLVDIQSHVETLKGVYEETVVSGTQDDSDPDYFASKCQVSLLTLLLEFMDETTKDLIPPRPPAQPQEEDPSVVESPSKKMRLSEEIQESAISLPETESQDAGDQENLTPGENTTTLDANDETNTANTQNGSTDSVDDSHHAQPSGSSHAPDPTPPSDSAAPSDSGPCSDSEKPQNSASSPPTAKPSPASPPPGGFLLDLPDAPDEPPVPNPATIQKGPVLYKSTSSSSLQFTNQTQPTPPTNPHTTHVPTNTTNFAQHISPYAAAVNNAALNYAAVYVPEGNVTHKLYVGNLNPIVSNDEDQLTNLVSPAATPIVITSGFQGFAFLYFATLEESQRARVYLKMYYPNFQVHYSSTAEDADLVVLHVANMAALQPPYSVQSVFSAGNEPLSGEPIIDHRLRQAYVTYTSFAAAVRARAKILAAFPMLVVKLKRRRGVDPEKVRKPDTQALDKAHAWPIAPAVAAPKPSPVLASFLPIENLPSSLFTHAYVDHPTCVMHIAELALSTRITSLKTVIGQFTNEFEIIFLAMCTDTHKIHSMVQFQSEEAAQKVKNSGVTLWQAHYMADDKAYTILMEAQTIMGSNKTAGNSKDTGKQTNENDKQAINSVPNKVQSPQKDMQEKLAKLKELEARLSKSRLALQKPGGVARGDEPQEPSSPHAKEQVLYSLIFEMVAGGKDTSQNKTQSEGQMSPRSEPSRVVHVNGFRDTKWWYYMLMNLPKLEYVWQYPGKANSYAHMYFPSIESSVAAYKIIQANNSNISFASVTQWEDPLTYVWVDCIDPNVSNRGLKDAFSKCGTVKEIYRPFGSDKAIVYYHKSEDALAAAKSMKCAVVGSTQLQVFFVRADQAILPPPKATALRTKFVYIPELLSEPMIRQILKFLKINIRCAIFFSFQGFVLQCGTEDESARLLEWFRVSNSKYEAKNASYFMLDEEDLTRTSRVPTRKLLVKKMKIEWDHIKKLFLSFEAFDHMRIYLDQDYATVTYRSEEHTKIAMRIQKFDCEFLEMNTHV
eukprot:Phypoly_transcript_01577.p1 GENE.Phypoly_transcript_01577~~Phypoly_transcript_01577.p1  ORF type:complete len:1081 (+),score=164.52 Phypoly_transcript_01577:49-3291(+)